MWIFLLLLTIFQGISTYLICISIAQIKNKETIINIIRQLSPYKLLEEYMPDKMFDSNIKIAIFSRGLLCITGCTGILLCLTIHDIYYRIYKSKNTLNKQEE